MSLADQIRAKMRRAIAISVLAGLLTSVLISTVWAPAMCLFIYLRLIRADKYIVWLRRFHRREPKRLRFNMLLNGACPGLCIPITIQDSVFKTSYYSSGSRMLLFAPVVFGLGALLYVLCALTITDSLITLGVTSDMNRDFGFLIALVPLVLYGYAVKKLMIKRGHVSLTPRNAIEVVDSTLQKVIERKLGFQGVLIFKCPDEVWQQVVSLVISRASAVIIDVSDITENVLWELRIALERHCPESVLLAFGVPNYTREELPSTTRSELEKVVGSDKLSRLQVFYYPAEQPSYGPSRGRLYTGLHKKLSEKLAACMRSMPPPLVAVGLTVPEVIGIMGSPDRIIPDVRGGLLYVYKTMKILFRDGEVSVIEHISLQDKTE